MNTFAAKLMLPLLILAILNLTVDCALDSSSNLQTAKQWKLFSYNFLPQAPINDVNFYNPVNILATGIAVGMDRIFIATPQLFSGVSSTVSFVSREEFGDSPVLQAYPDWSFSTTGRKNFNCSDLVLISSYRLRIDSCNRLWVLDAGVSRSLEDFEITCPPKILVIDLQTNQVVRRVDFPREVLRGESLFTNLVIDETTSKSGTCDDVFVYITDTVEPAIVVYDSERDVTWRLSHPAMYPDPDFAQSEVQGHRFILMDGVVGLTFDEKAGIVYFQPLATDRVFSITKQELRAGPLPANKALPVKLVGKKSSQGIGLAVSPIDGSILFSPMSETAIASYNPTTQAQSILAVDRNRLQFVADITTSRFDPGFAYALSSKFHRFFLKNLSPSEYNNRILRIELPNAGISKSRVLPNVAPSVPLISSTPNYGSFYHTNDVGKRLPASGFFTSSAPIVQPQFHHQFHHLHQHNQPYSYEPLGIINYSLRNPFNSLNQGESFPPSKQNRDIFQKSYLDTLIDGQATPTPFQNAYSTIPIRSGYHYERGLRYPTELETTTKH